MSQGLFCSKMGENSKFPLQQNVRFFQQNNKYRVQNDKNAPLTIDI
jgi:hypothetical protein